MQSNFVRSNIKAAGDFTELGTCSQVTLKWLSSISIRNTSSMLKDSTLSLEKGT